MLKINLSDSESKKKKAGSEENFPATETLGEIPADPPFPPSKTNKKEGDSSAPKKPNKLLLVILLAVLFFAICYLQKDFIQKYMPDISKLTKKTPQKIVPEPGKPQPVETTETESEIASVSSHFDPVFDSLTKITEAMPVKIWLSSIDISYDGSFSLKAVSFDYKNIADFIKSLGDLAEIDSQKIPPASKSAEAVYNFTITGKIKNPDIPDIMDTVSSDSLASYSFPAALPGKNTGVKLTRLPNAGAKYKDNDMPFVMDGEIGAIEKVIAGIFEGKNNLRIYRFSIQGLPGSPYDKVRASFSIRSVPAL